LFIYNKRLSVGNNTVKLGNVAKGVEISFAKLALSAKQIGLV
jgi:hypothetical protein